jgi:hypothetical protein
MSAVAVVDPATLADTQQGSDNNRVVGGSTNRHGATPSSEAARAEPANMHLEKEILGLLQTVVQSNSDVLKGNQALMTSFFNHQQQQVQQSQQQQQQQQESRQPHHQHDSRHHHGHHQQHRGVRASGDGHDGRKHHLQTSSEKEAADHRGGSMPMQLQQWMRPTPSEARTLTEDRVDVTDISNEMPEPVSSKESSAPAPVVALAPASEPAPAPARTPKPGRRLGTHHCHSQHPTPAAQSGRQRSKNLQNTSWRRRLRDFHRLLGRGQGNAMLGTIRPSDSQGNRIVRARQNPHGRILRPVTAACPNRLQGTEAPLPVFEAEFGTHAVGIA